MNTTNKNFIMDYKEGWDIVYRNRWGHFVWKQNDGTPENMNWPGSKPPSKDSEPMIIGDAWFWINRKDMSI